MVRKYEVIRPGADLVELRSTVQKFLEGEKFAQVARMLEKTGTQAGSAWKNGVFMSVTKDLNWGDYAQMDWEAWEVGKYFIVEFLLCDGYEEVDTEATFLVDWPIHNRAWEEDLIRPGELAFLSGRVQCFSYNPHVFFSDLRMTIAYFIGEFEPTDFASARP